MLIPPVMMVLTIIWLLVWLTAAVHVYAIGEIKGVDSPDNAKEVTKFYGECVLTEE